MAPQVDFNKRNVTFYSTVTLAYIALIILLMHYYNCLYEIGKCRSLLTIAALAVAEVCKLIFLQTLHTDKTKKTKAHTLKGISKSLLVIFELIAVFYVLAVLFGAPFLSNQEETLMFSLLVTMLSVLPCCLHLGADETLCILMDSKPSSLNQFEEMLKNSAYYTLFGAWLGAVVIPLDWDVPWQVWPIPCSIGALLGCMCSHVLALLKIVFNVASNTNKKTGKYSL